MHNMAIKTKPTIISLNSWLTYQDKLKLGTLPKPGHAENDCRFYDLEFQRAQHSSEKINGAGGLEKDVDAQRGCLNY